MNDKIDILENPELNNPSYEQLIALRNQKINELNDIVNRLRMIGRTHKAVTTSNGRNIGEYNKKNRKQWIL